MTKQPLRNRSAAVVEPTNWQVSNPAERAQIQLIIFLTLS